MCRKTVLSWGQPSQMLQNLLEIATPEETLSETTDTLSYITITDK